MWVSGLSHQLLWVGTLWETLCGIWHPDRLGGGGLEGAVSQEEPGSKGRANAEPWLTHGYCGVGLLVAFCIPFHQNQMPSSYFMANPSKTLALTIKSSTEVCR